MPTRQFKVLLVDDDEPRRCSTAQVLAAAGHSVLDAASGLDALELARQLPDVILLDVNLPDMDGFEVCHKLKQDLQTAPAPARPGSVMTVERRPAAPHSSRFRSNRSSYWR